jgi:hypothetical protein
MDDQARAAPTALIIDDDLGFVCWLGEIFKEAGCRVLPALSCGDAVMLTKRLSVKPDLIILNPHLGGAANMLQNYIQTEPLFNIATIGPPSKALGASIHVHATLERPSPSEPLLREEWLEKLRKLLRQVEAAGAG